MSTHNDLSTVSQRIKNFNAHLLQDKVQLKYKLLATDPFRFLRGTNHLFYEDLLNVSLPASPTAWLCGDLHLENFGSYKGDNRLVYFDINDFDEAILGPATWDLVRIITSIFTGFEVLEIEKEQTMKLARQFLKTYSSFLAKGKARYIETDTAKGMIREFLEKLSQRTQKELLKDRVSIKKNKTSIKTDGKKYLEIDKEIVVTLSEHLDDWIKNHEKKFPDIKLEDACFRIAGTGSLGVKRYMLLLLQTKGNKKRYRLVDMKQVLPSSLQPYTPIDQPAWQTEAERSTSVKFILQNVPPALLDTTVFRGDTYSLQELQPSEDKIDFTLIRDRFEDIQSVVNNMAMLTASAQLRGSGWKGSAIADELIAFGNNHQWQNAIIDYGKHYAEQVKKDYKEFKEDFKKGLTS